MNQRINGFSSIEQVAGRYLPTNQKKDSVDGKKDFASYLSDQVKFSKHASMRLDERNIELSTEQSKRLFTGIEKAGQKGIQDSLVIMDSMAFIVNVPSQTVVTAMDSVESEDKIFTNIDGAVIV